MNTKPRNTTGGWGTRLATLLLLLGWPILSYAQLDFPSSLRNELDLSPIDASAREVVVLIHGWTGESTVPVGYSRYDDSADAPEMYYLFNILKLKLAASSRRLVTYHWEKDASTGLVDMNPLNGALIQDAVRNATTAANRAVSHGTHLAELLNDQAPELRRVQFIAHSAGSWAARRAAIELLNLNPYVVVQVTLLDPFIPGGVPPPWTPTTTLVKSLMDDMIWISGSSRIYRLENYYADDIFTTAQFPTLGTQETFVWRSQDINQQVDHGSTGIPGLHLWYDFHSGPLEFYGDTVSASILGNPVPLGLTTLTPSFVTLGWYRSLTAESAFLPNITTHPQSQTASPGQSVTLNVVATSSQALSYQWYRNGSLIIGAEGTSHTFTASAGSPTTYAVRVSNATGPVFSEKAVVSVYASLPTISSVSPRTFTGPTKLITITGTGFTSNSRLTFNDGVNPPYTDRVPASWTPTQLTYDISVGSNLATWTVKVVNGAVESLPYSFYVVSGTAQLTSLGVSGPAAIAENGSSQFTATAYFSDGSQQNVTSSANWSENSSATTISASGFLSAGSVGSDTAVTVSASYTTGGITKSGSANVTIANSGSCGSTVSEKILNGNFANNGNNWSLSGNFFANATFSVCNSCPGYAWFANADGTGGNNLSGTLSQSITIPANATLATLGYYYRITTSETGTGAFDILRLNLVLPGGSLVGLDERSNLHANASYGYRSFNVTAYKGQTITVRFTATTDGSFPTAFRVDDVSLLVSASNPITPVLFGVGGPTSVAENSTAQYQAVVVNCDGSIQSVTPTWSENSSATSISSSGLLTVGSVNSDTPATITATHNGTSLQYPITVVNSSASFSYLAISGPSSINENSSGQFTASAIFSDGSSQSVSPNWSENSSATTFSGSGLLNAGGVGSDTIVTVSANHTIGGVTRNANQEVFIVNVPSPVTLTSLAISGPTTMNENSTAQYTATASFNDGSSQGVNPTWGEDSSATSISIFGLLSAGEVASDTPMTVSASCSFGGVTRNASKSVTVVDGTVTPTYTLTVSASNGTVAKNPDQANYPSGSQVLLTATPGNGYQFAGWSGDAGGSVNPLTVTMNANKNITANFIVTAQLPHLGESSASNGTFRFALRGLVGSNYHVQASSNLVDWITLGIHTIPAGGSLTITEAISGKARRFFRAVPQGEGPAVVQADSKDIWTTSVYSYAPGGGGPGGGQNDDKLRVGGWADEYYSLLQFDLTGLPASAASAMLHVYCYNQSGGGTTMYLDRITQAWDWRTQGTGSDRDRLWWADRPPTTQWSAGEIPNPSQGQWYAVDITSLYNAWQGGTYPNYGVQFRPVNFFNNNFNEFYSADYVNDPTLRPKLIITVPAGVSNVIAAGLNSVTSLVPDGDYIYFADPTSVDGIMKRVLKTGGAVSTLATGLATSDGHSPSFVVNSGTIYGGYGGYNAYNIFSMPAGGGSAPTLASITGGGFFGVAGSQIYFGSGFNYLNSISTSGGSPTELAANNWVRSVAVDSSAIYFVEYFSRDVRKCSLPSGAVTPLITGNASEGSVFIDAVNVYFNLGGNIEAVPKSGGAVMPLVSSGSAVGHTSDGVRVFFVENDTIKSIPVGGGSVATLVIVPPNSLTSLAVDDSFIYWGENSGGVGAGKVWRMAKP